MNGRKRLMRKIAGLIIAVTVLAVWGAVPAFAASGWALQATPSTTTWNGLNTVSCVSASDCWAFGSDSDLNLLAEKWNGSTWTIQSMPGDDPEMPWDVSCDSAGDCMLLGLDLDASYPFLDYWNGSTWTALGLPGITVSLQSVSCFSGSNCVVVGGDLIDGTVADWWNGSAWTAETTMSNVPDGGLLSSVSCVTASDCMTVGASGTGPYAAFAEHWNGRSWTEEAMAQEDASTSPTSVSCTSATFCMATGVALSADDENSYALAEKWNGSTWTASGNAQSPDDEATFAGVACVSAANCTAVGSYQTGPSSNPNTLTESLSESWNGSAWTTQAMPSPSGSLNTIPDGISCPSATDCEAVGAWEGTSPAYLALAEQWTS
jgi:hypothetical protein